MTQRFHPIEFGGFEGRAAHGGALEGRLGSSRLISMLTPIPTSTPMIPPGPSQRLHQELAYDVLAPRAHRRAHTNLTSMRLLVPLKVSDVVAQVPVS